MRAPRYTIMGFVGRRYTERLILYLAVTTLVATAGQVMAGVVHPDERVSSFQESYINVVSGVISSPNFPSSYGPDVDSTWRILGEKNQKVRLKFEAFMLENSTNCARDYVSVSESDQADKNAKPTKYCGNLSPFTITSVSNGLVVTFHSDSKNQFPGFQATFQLISDSTNANAVKKTTGETESSKPKAGSCECGVADERHRRIIGGNVSQPQQYPWLAVLARKEKLTAAHCGAVLICPRYLLTAAHCAYMKPNNYYSAILGAYDLTKPAPSQLVVGVKRLIPHEDYYKPTENNDIALVELDRDVPYNSAIKPICMPPTGKDFAGDKGAVAGWGRTAYGGQLSSVPREVIMPIVDNVECQRSFSQANANITENMMCAGVLDGSIDACQGDSGGPLMWTDPSDHRYKTIGITSFGVRCATVGYYGAYTRVNRYFDWIKKNVGNACPCIFNNK